MPYNHTTQWVDFSGILGDQAYWTALRNTTSFAKKPEGIHLGYETNHPCYVRMANVEQGFVPGFKECRDGWSSLGLSGNKYPQFRIHDNIREMDEQHDYDDDDPHHIQSIFVTTQSNTIDHCNSTYPAVPPPGLHNNRVPLLSFTLCAKMAG